MTTTLRPCPTDTSAVSGLRAGPLTAEQQDARWALMAAAAAWREQVRTALLAVERGLPDQLSDLCDARLWGSKGRILRVDHFDLVPHGDLPDQIPAVDRRAHMVAVLLEPERLASALRLSAQRREELWDDLVRVSATMARIVRAMGLAAAE